MRRVSVTYLKKMVEKKRISQQQMEEIINHWQAEDTITHD